MLDTQRHLLVIVHFYVQQRRHIFMISNTNNTTVPPANANGEDNDDEKWHTLGCKAKHNKNDNDNKKWHPLSDTAKANNENDDEKWHLLGGEAEENNNDNVDEDYNNELLETVKTIHITSYMDVLGDIDICRFDTQSDMRNTIETWCMSQQGFAFMSTVKKLNVMMRKSGLL